MRPHSSPLSQAIRRSHSVFLFGPSFHLSIVFAQDLGKFHWIDRSSDDLSEIFQYFFTNGFSLVATFLKICLTDGVTQNVQIYAFTSGRVDILFPFLTPLTMTQHWPSSLAVLISSKTTPGCASKVQSSPQVLVPLLFS